MSKRSGVSLAKSKQNDSWQREAASDIELKEVEETEADVLDREQELSKKLHEAFEKSEWNNKLVELRLKPSLRLRYNTLVIKYG